MRTFPGKYSGENLANKKNNIKCKRWKFSLQKIQLDKKGRKKNFSSSKDNHARYMETRYTGTYADRSDQKEKSNSRAYKSTINNIIDKIILKVIRNTLRNPPKMRK